MPFQPFLTEILRPSASVKEAMSSALPKACSEICARELPFMPRQEWGEICLTSTTRAPTQRPAGGCTASASHLSSAETIGQASVAVGFSATGPTEPVTLPCAGPSRGGEKSCGELEPTATLA